MRGARFWATQGCLGGDREGALSGRGGLEEMQDADHRLGRCDMQCGGIFHPRHSLESPRTRPLSGLF